MFSNVFQNADKFAIFPIISLFLFFSIFISVLFWLVIIKKSYIDHMSQLPLDEQYSKELKV